MHLLKKKPMAVGGGGMTYPATPVRTTMITMVVQITI